jgi:hypothetical protein
LYHIFIFRSQLRVTVSWVKKELEHLAIAFSLVLSAVAGIHK